MILQTVTKFVTALIGSLAAFYLASHVLHAIGFMNAQELQRVVWMYNQLLEPVIHLSWTTQRTILIVIVALSLQTLVVAYLVRRWAYKPSVAADPLARLQRKEPSLVTSSEHLMSRDVPQYRGHDAADDIEPEPAVDHASAEEQRLIRLLQKHTV